MTEHKEYRLVTMADVIQNVPPDRLDAFIADFRAFVEHSQGVMAKLHEEHDGIGALLPDTEMVWVDDGNAGNILGTTVTLVPQK